MVRSKQRSNAASSASSAFGNVSNSGSSSESSESESPRPSRPRPSRPSPSNSSFKRRRTQGLSAASSADSALTTVSFVAGGVNPLAGVKVGPPKTIVIRKFQEAAKAADAADAADAAENIGMSHLGLAVWKLVEGFVSQSNMDCMKGVFNHTFCMRIVDVNTDTEKHIDLVLGGLNVPNVKKHVFSKYSISPTDPNTVRLVLCGHPAFMSLLGGNRVVFYIPTPQLMKAGGAISEEGFVDPYARLTPNFNDPNHVTVIEMNAARAQAAFNYDTILQLFVIVAINYLKLRGLFPDTADSIPSSQASNFNGMIGAQMMEMIKKELEITFDGNRWNPAILKFMCGVGEDIPDFRTLYRTVLRAFLSGFKQACMMAHAWSSGTSALALPAFPAFPASAALALPALPAGPAEPVLPAEPAIFSNSADGVQWDEEAEV